MLVESANSTLVFWYAQKLRQVVYLGAFSIVIHRKFNSNVSAFQHSSLLVSKLDELSLSDVSRSLRLIYIWDLLLFLFMESSIGTVCTYWNFFLTCKLYNSGLQIMLLISDHLRFMASADIGDF